jgi:phosphoribosylformylglycinamidine synthase
LQHPDWGAILPREREDTRYDRALLDVLASPNVAGKERVFRTYDHTIGSNTVLQPGQADAAVLRIKSTRKGIALTTDCNSRYCYLDPYEGGVHAVAEAARNLSCVGAEPLAVTDCLNFGDPERPEVFYQMESAVNGIADACNTLEIPVVSGNVSLYNETNGVAVLPTPMIGMIGLLEDVDRRASIALRDGLQIGMLWAKHVGDEPHRGGAHLLGASQYAETCLNLKAGMPITVDLDAERAVQMACRVAIRVGLVNVAHDCSDGGLAVALAEMCIAGGVGATITLDEVERMHPRLRSDVYLLAEEPSRIIIALRPEHWTDVQDLARASGVTLLNLGTSGNDALHIYRGGRALVSQPLTELEQAWRGGLS